MTCCENNRIGRDQHVEATNAIVRIESKPASQESLVRTATADVSTSPIATLVATEESANLPSLQCAANARSDAHGPQVEPWPPPPRQNLQTLLSHTPPFQWPIDNAGQALHNRPVTGSRRPYCRRERPRSDSASIARVAPLFLHQHTNRFRFARDPGLRESRPGMRCLNTHGETASSCDAVVRHPQPGR
jgi:hypothetical protein